jgi:tetratricopeptide (TPR) repeat protein
MIDAARIGGSTPSYTHALAVLGQYCNQQRARSITLAQVETGFILHFYPKSQWNKPASIDVHNADLLELSGAVSGNSGDKNGTLFRGGDNVDRKHPLLPMGYAMTLRAIGIKLDRRKAVGVTICDTKDALFLNYWVDKATFLIRDGRRQGVSNVHLERYDKAGVQRMLADSNDEFSREAGRYEHTMRANPYDHITTLAAAFLFESDGKYRDAESLFVRIAAQVPRHPEAHYHVARLALMRGDRRTALNEVRKALDILPEGAAIHDLHGRILRKNKKLKEAAAAFEQAVALDDDNGIHHYHLSLAYEAQGRKDEAVVQMALSTGQDLAPAWEMVQEEIAAEHVALVRSAAELAVEQVASEPQVQVPVPVPAVVMTTDFAETDTGWEQEAGSEEEEREAVLAGASIPKLTTFDEEEVTPDWAESPGAEEHQLLLKPMTLEQRLRAAGPLPSARREVFEPPPPVSLTPSGPVREPAPPPDDWSIAPTPLPSADPGGHSRGEPLAARESSRSSRPAPSDSGPGQERSATPSPEWTSARADAGDSVGNLSARVTGQGGRPSTPSEQAASMPAGRPAAASSSKAATPAGSSSNAVELATEILVIQRALTAEPNRADLHRKLGFLLARQGKTAEAATEFRKALQASRTNL